jgi:hypothetical protein
LLDEETGNVYRIFVEKSAQKLLFKISRTFEDNTVIYLYMGYQMGRRGERRHKL